MTNFARLQPLVLKMEFPTPTLGLQGTWAHSMDPPGFPISSPKTRTVYLSLFLSYLPGSKGVSAHPLIHPQYKANYSSRSYCLIVLQKLVVSIKRLQVSVYVG